MLRLGKAVQVLSLVVLCAVFFGTAARAAEREAPRGKAPKAEASKAEASKEEAKQRRELQRPGKPVGKWSTMKSLTGTQDGINDCSVSCNDWLCVCYYDWWDGSCCDFACNYCWLLQG